MSSSLSEELYKIMKPFLAYLIPVNSVVQDKLSNKWTLSNLFDIISIPKSSEFSFQTFQVFGRIDNVPDGPSTTVVSIVNEDGRETAKAAPLSGVLKKGSVQFYAEFLSIQIKEPGRYFFRTTLNGKELSTSKHYYFDVSKKDD